MTRLFINLFFIIVIGFTLSVLPLNTAAIDMFDLSDIFSSAPEEEVVEEPADETFEAVYSVEYKTGNDKRLYNPKNIEFTLTTNHPENSTVDLDKFSIKLYQNGELFQVLKDNQLTVEEKPMIINGTITADYSVDIAFETLALNRDGYFDLEVVFDESIEVPSNTYQVAYRPTIDYVDNGQAQGGGKFIYKAYFKNITDDHLVPLYYSVDYPDSITVEVRNRLYNPPADSSGLNSTAVIPANSSVRKLADKAYGVFFLKTEIDKVISTKAEAELAIESMVKSLTRLPNIDTLTFYVDGSQAEGLLYDIDLKKIYEKDSSTYVYLSEMNDTEYRYLIPIPVSENNVYDEVLTIFNTLKTGYIDDKQWMQIVPPEVEMKTFIIEGTTITADFNEAFLTAYTSNEEYKRMMINSILYSFTSNPNISKVVITVNGELVTDYAGYDFTEPQLEPSYINFITE